VNKLQLSLNSQARAIMRLPRSTPLVFLQGQLRLPSAKELIDQRQTRYAARALSADGDHPTHQLLPANLRLGELYGYESGTPQPSSIGWTRPERTHRLFGNRLAQQIVKHVYYDTEYGFDLPCRQGLLVTAPTIWRHGLLHMSMRMLPDHPLQTTLFVELAKDISVGVGATWKERDGWKTKTASLAGMSQKVMPRLSRDTDPALLRLRSVYMGIFGAIECLAVVAAPLVGGILTQKLSWR
jgi:hypothetical protein